MSTQENLATNNITLPEVAAPAAAYVPSRTGGSIVYVSGQLPFEEGELRVTGHLGKNVNIEQGQHAARVCGLNLLAHLKNACDGDLDRVTQVLKLEILVAATPDFTEPHVVANGASELILEVFGPEIGAHARVAYGVATLPMGVAVEVAGTFEINA